MSLTFQKNIPSGCERCSLIKFKELKEAFMQTSKKIAHLFEAHSHFSKQINDWGMTDRLLTTDDELSSAINNTNLNSGRKQANLITMVWIPLTAA